MKAGKLAIRPKLSCQYSENTLMDLLSSLKGDHKYVLWKSYFKLRNLCAYNFFIIPNTAAVGTFSGPQAIFMVKSSKKFLFLANFCSFCKMLEQEKWGWQRASKRLLNLCQPNRRFPKLAFSKSEQFRYFSLLFYLNFFIVLYDFHYLDQPGRNWIPTYAR